MPITQVKPKHPIKILEVNKVHKDFNMFLKSLSSEEFMVTLENIV